MKKSITMLLVLAMLCACGSALAEVTYPVEGAEGITLTWAKNAQSQITTQYSSWAETPVFQAWMKATGITVTTIEPADSQAMNLLFASGSAPDMVLQSWINYGGGIAKAISDGVVRPINDLLDDYAPDYKAVIESNEDYRRDTMTNNGDVYGFAFIRGDESLCVFGGAIIRADWLKKCGLENPETLSEFYDMLVAFRDQCGATAPISVAPDSLVSNGDGQGNYMLGAFGLPSAGFYHEGDVVKYGYYSEEMKEVYAFINKLYNENLLDHNFATLDDATIDANFYNGVSGLKVGLLGGGIGTTLTTMKDDPEFDVMGMNFLVADDQKGSKSVAGHYIFPVTPEAAVITTSCQHPELAAQFLNYGYTEEGHMLLNFGIEGESYEMIDGYPTYTDMITNNPEGLSVQYAMAPYTFSWNSGSCVQDKRYIEQYLGLPQQQAALKTWMNTTRKDSLIPNINVPDDQLARFVNLNSDIDTYTREMRVKFITGEESLDNYDAYMDQLRAMGVEELIAIEQAAYDAYLAR